MSVKLRRWYLVPVIVLVLALIPAHPLRAATEPDFGPRPSSSELAAAPPSAQRAAALAANDNALWSGDFQPPGIAGLGNGGNRVSSISDGTSNTILIGEATPVAEIGGVNAMLTVSDTVIIGGEFTTVGGQPATGVAQWNGRRWTPLVVPSTRSASLRSSTQTALGDGSVRFISPSIGSPSSGLQPIRVNALALFEGDLIAAGRFSSLGGTFAPGIARYDFDKQRWSPLGGFKPSLSTIEFSALAVISDSLYVAGQFAVGDSAGERADNLMVFSGGVWKRIDAGLQSKVGAAAGRALAVDGTDLYIGGQFTQAGPIDAMNIVRYATTTGTFNALGSGITATDPAAAVVRALQVNGKDIIAGGSFQSAGGVAAANVARFDGAAWSAVGAGLPAAPSATNGVAALTVLSGAVYAGGRFAAVNSVQPFLSVFTGTDWISQPPPAGAVRALAPLAGQLVVGGAFETGPHVLGGTSYLPLGSSVFGSLPTFSGLLQDSVSRSSLTFGSVSAVLPVGADLFVAGDFQFAGPNQSRSVARWNSTTQTWSPIPGIGAAVSRSLATARLSGARGLAFRDGKLYVAGTFTVQTTQGTVDAAIAAWDGAAWEVVLPGTTASGQRQQVDAITFNQRGDLFAAGNIFIGGAAAPIVQRPASPAGAAFVALPAPGTNTTLNPTVRALLTVGDDLIAAGNFNIGNDGSVNFTGSTLGNIARWNGTSWSSLGTGTSGEIRSLALLGNDIVAGGAFFSAGGVAASRIARWDGVRWNALGFGVSSTVTALAAIGANLFAAGDFLLAGNARPNDIFTAHVARWNGLVWSPLGAGFSFGDSGFQSLAISESGDVYLGGSGLSTAGGKPAFRLARFQFALTDAAVDFDADPNPVAVGAPLTYTLSVRNPGRTVVAAPSVQVSIPPTVTITASSAGRATDGCGQIGPVFLCNFADVGPGNVVTAVIRTTPTAAGIITATASMNAAGDQVAANNLVVATTLAASANPVPQIGQLIPGIVTAGASVGNIGVIGASFIPGAAVLLNGAPLTTTFVSEFLLTAALPPGLAVGDYPVTVSNPAPGGGASQPLTLTVASNPVGVTALPVAPKVTTPGVQTTFVVSWTHPTAWRNLATFDFRIRGVGDPILWVRLTESITPTLTLLDPLGLPLAEGEFGENLLFENGTMTMSLANATLAASGQTLVMTLVVTFKDTAVGAGYSEEFAMMDDNGVVQGPDLRGTLDIRANQVFAPTVSK